jgi:hypothetical protein
MKAHLLSVHIAPAVKPLCGAHIKGVRIPSSQKRVN